MWLDVKLANQGYYNKYYCDTWFWLFPSNSISDTITTSNCDSLTLDNTY